jgi:DNA (cytosine-5)-methyltransferase 1
MERSVSFRFFAFTDRRVGATTALTSSMSRPTCIDLFSGCGGLSLGLGRADFSILAAIDFDEHAIRTYKENFPNVEHALHKDLTKFPARELAKLIGTTQVDVIVGGPPCQGFSTARRRDGANNGPRLIEDGRRHLYKQFLQYVEFFRPKVFVMENVLGIKSADNGQYFTRIQREGRKAGYRVHPQVERVWDLGVPQKRVRQLIIGTRLDLVSYFPGKLEPAPRASDKPTLGEAIGDLPIVRAGGGEDESEYDMPRRLAHVGRYGRKFLYRTLEVQLAEKLTAHRARPHSERDLRDFARLNEGENSKHAMNRGEQFEFPYSTESFKDRYTRQHRDHPCSTIVAHMSKDGLMFIHPTQNRSLTPREAARVQSFPDWFKFPVPRTQQFRLIGNAVPPLVGEAIGLSVKEYLKRVTKTPPVGHWIPSDIKEAAHQLSALVSAADRNRLHAMAADEFKRGWLAVGFLYPELHPDAALEHGAEQSATALPLPEVRCIEPRLVAPVDVQSGWPVVLRRVIREARRRYQSGELAERDFYSDAAAAAGMCYRAYGTSNAFAFEGDRVFA